MKGASWAGIGASLIVAAATCAPLSAAGGKMGYIDVERVFEKYQKTIDINARLQDERKEKIAQRKTMVEEINKLKDEADLLRDEAKQKKEASVDEKVKKLYQFEEKVTREALKKNDMLKEEILAEVKGVIADLGKAEGYDMIFSFTGDDIAYRADRLDLTERVVAALNKKYAETKK